MNAEYLKYHSSERMKMERAARNKVRRKFMREGKVKEGQEIDHVDGNPMNNSPSNLRVVSRHTNRVKQ